MCRCFILQFLKYQFALNITPNANHFEPWHSGLDKWALYMRNYFWGRQWHWLRQVGGLDGQTVHCYISVCPISTLPTSIFLLITNIETVELKKTFFWNYFQISKISSSLLHFVTFMTFVTKTGNRKEFFFALTLHPKGLQKPQATCKFEECTFMTVERLANASTCDTFTVGSGHINEVKAAHKGLTVVW